MFVNITNPKKPLEAEKLFRACWRKGEEITPAVCFEVLKSTNYVTCIKRMLECVERLEVSKQAKFKGVVLSCFENREQPESVVDVGKRIAVALGYEKEFLETAGNIYRGLYIKSSPNASVYEVFNRDDYKEYDFSRSKAAMFTSPVVDLTEAESLPEDLDFLMCQRVFLDRCDLSGVKNLRFGAGEYVRFEHTKLPEILDVSGVDTVALHCCDLSRPKKITFKEGAAVYFCASKNLPENLDVSGLRYMNFGRCDLSRVKNLTFRKNARVDMVDVSGLPGETDFSMCEYDGVYMNRADISKVKKMTFAGRLQMEKSGVRVPNNWGGKMYFEEKEPERIVIRPYLKDGR